VIYLPALRAPFGHYSPLGNQFLANQVFEGLRACYVVQG
jgi:hypothetical protein